MAGDRSLLGVLGCDQWVRAAHTGTTVGPRGVGLSWTLPAPPAAEPFPAVTVQPRGLAFDRFCRAYLATPENVLRIRFGDTSRGVDYAKVPPAEPLFEAAGQQRDGTGGFAPVRPRAALADPVATGVDEDDRLVIAERGSRRITFVDLWQRRTVRQAETATARYPARAPLDLSVDGRLVWVLTEEPAALLRLTARRGPEEMELPAVPAGFRPVRLTLAEGLPVLLAAPGADPEGHCVLVSAGTAPLDVGPASAVAAGVGLVAVAPPAGGRYLVRYARVAGGWERVDALDITDYDGIGIAVTGAGRIAYTTAAGLRLAVGTRVRYTPQGRVVTFRLDAGEAAARWGRLFIDACLPVGTQIRYAVRTSDDESAGAIARTAADAALCAPEHPDLSPPMPPPELDVPLDLVQGQLYERVDTPLPWWRHRVDEKVLTLEGYVQAPAGRYAWVTLRLIGSSGTSPLVQGLRLEARTHTLTRRLPAVFEDNDQAGFLHRYLALFDGLLHDLDQRSARRELLLDPESAPAEALDWLASFVGLVLDERWPVRDRRLLIAQAAWLYRYRGTVAALTRYLALYLHAEPVILEHFRLRGFGGPVLGAGGGADTSRSILGLGMRVGGPVGNTGDARETGGAADPSAAFRPQAHRFSVYIPRPLSAEQQDVVRLILDRERPAHTVVDVCTVDAGLRVGVGDHLQLSTMVGRTGGFTPLTLEQSVLGTDGTLGRALPGAVVDSTRLGRTRAG